VYTRFPGGEALSGEETLIAVGRDLSMWGLHRPKVSTHQALAARKSKDRRIGVAMARLWSGRDAARSNPTRRATCHRTNPVITSRLSEHSARP